jgi:Zn/Cd-binding protein ZinT
MPQLEYLKKSTFLYAIVWRVRKIPKSDYKSSWQSVCPYGNNSDPNGQIFMKFYKRVFRKSKFQ